MAQTLYRKYRSQRFEELVGQTAVTRVLRNSIVRDRVNHAYLFAGPRGTGKTSVARIFAKALNCLHPHEGDACGECEVCTSIAAGAAVDVIEIDAASNRGIDDIRDLRERVNYAPIELRYKVYIIDEAHMITGPGFNALLKTLEEPPSFVVFCLCTTEAHKLPITILSRCIRFDFQRLPLDELAGHLRRIAAAEGQQLADDAAHELATLAEGSARDAISLLDQLTVYCDAEINVAAIHQLFQLADREPIERLADMLSLADPEPVLAAWRGMLAQGMDAGRFLLRLADELKRRYISQPSAQLRAALEVLWRGANMLRQESYPALLVELTLIEAQAVWHQPTGRSAAAPAPVNQPTVSAPPPQVRSAEPRSAQPAPTMQIKRDRPAQPPVSPPPAPAPPASKPSVVTPAVAQAKPAAGDPEEPLWARFLDGVRALRVTTYSLVFSCPGALYAQGVLEITLGANQRLAFSAVQKAENVACLLQVAGAVYGPGTEITVGMEGQPAGRVSLGRVPAPGAGGPTEDIPLELTAEVVDAPYEQEPQAGELDVAELTRVMESLNEQLRAAEDAQDKPKNATAGKRPVTAQDAINLFEAEELDDGELKFDVED